MKGKNDDTGEMNVEDLVSALSANVSLSSEEVEEMWREVFCLFVCLFFHPLNVKVYFKSWVVSVFLNITDTKHNLNSSEAPEINFYFQE